MASVSNHQNGVVGFCLLPSELIQTILLHLSLPEILHMKLLNKSISFIISDHNFIQACNSKSMSSTWLFVCKKRWRRDLMLYGFSDDQSHRWFRIPIDQLLKPLIFPGEDIYFLTANANFFLFVSNTRQEVLAVNLVLMSVKKIPHSPLGPRGTSSWRRSGIKLIRCPGSGSGSAHFRFLFAELVDNVPLLFEYQSETDTWRSTEAVESQYCEEIQRGSECVFLNASESTVVATRVVNKSNVVPIVVRPRFNMLVNEPHLAVGFRRPMNRIHVYGDGYMMIIKSDEISVDGRERVVKEIEIWGLSGRSGGEYKWEYVSRVKSELMDKINKKPFGVIMGCLEVKNGVIKGVLMSNLDGLWDIIWLVYDINNGEWSWVKVPDSNTKGSNMAGISFSSGLTL
ncbi:hypothetical protein ACFE04_019283 [Oxalis oulophora]